MATPSLRLDVFSLSKWILGVRDPRQEHRRLKICSALLIICFNTAHCGGLPADGKMTARKLDIPPRVTEINLDFTPMTDPISAFVLLGDNKAKVVYYARHQLNVVAMYQGSLPLARVSHLLARMDEPAFVEALGRQNFGGTGISRGDQFYLLFRSQGSVAGECFGFVDDAPAIVRSLIKDLLAEQKQLKESALSDAYMRSEPIAPRRVEALQRSRKVRFASIQEFSPDIQPILTLAAVSPRDFLALSRTQYAQLLPKASQGHEFFMTLNGSGYQLTLFSAAQNRARPPKGDN